MSLIATPPTSEKQPVAISEPKSERPKEPRARDESDGATQGTSSAPKNASYGPSSPSPRGVETWGPCSPFVLPDPSTHITLIEHEEISLVLDGHLNGKIGNEAANKSHKVGLPKSGLMELETIFETTEPLLRAIERPVNGSISHAATLDDLSAMESDEHDRFIDDLFLQLKTNTHQDAGSNQQSCSIRDTDKCLSIHPNTHLDHGASLNYGIDRKDDEKHGRHISDIREVQKLVMSTHVIDGGKSRIRGENAFREGVIETYQIPTKVVKPQLFQRGKNVLHANLMKDKMNTNDNSPGEHLSEEELKRIRRVKNRASVEKCRTKQRLRMEALQTELKTLTSENKALRDLTTWMDPSVVVISTQLSETASSSCPQKQTSSSSSASMKQIRGKVEDLLSN